MLEPEKPSFQDLIDRMKGIPDEVSKMLPATIVTGRSNAGKSKFANVSLGMNLFPTAAGTQTAYPTVARAGPGDSYDIVAKVSEGDSESRSFQDRGKLYNFVKENTKKNKWKTDKEIELFELNYPEKSVEGQGKYRLIYDLPGSGDILNMSSYYNVFYTHAHDMACCYIINPSDGSFRGLGENCVGADGEASKTTDAEEEKRRGELDDIERIMCQSRNRVSFVFTHIDDYMNAKIHELEDQGEEGSDEELAEMVAKDIQDNFVAPIKTKFPSASFFFFDISRRVDLCYHSEEGRLQACSESTTKENGYFNVKDFDPINAKIEGYRQEILQNQTLRLQYLLFSQLLDWEFRDFLPSVKLSLLGKVKSSTSQFADHAIDKLELWYHKSLRDVLLKLLKRIKEEDKESWRLKKSNYISYLQEQVTPCIQDELIEKIRELSHDFIRLSSERIKEEFATQEDPSMDNLSLADLSGDARVGEVLGTTIFGIYGIAGGAMVTAATVVELVMSRLIAGIFGGFALGIITFWSLVGMLWSKDKTVESLATDLHKEMLKTIDEVVSRFRESLQLMLDHTVDILVKDKFALSRKVSKEHIMEVFKVDEEDASEYLQLRETMFRGYVSYKQLFPEEEA